MNSENILTEHGKKFGLLDSSDFYQVYQQFNLVFLDLLEKRIETDEFNISDYAGGNGVLAQDLIKILIKKGFTKFKIENIDNDESKFRKLPFLKNIKEDVLSYTSKFKYDYSICRFLLHYFDEDTQLELLTSINKNLKKNGLFLLVNFVLDREEEYKIKRRILDLIEHTKKISKRTILTSKQIIDKCRKAGFRLVDIVKMDYTLSIDDFYRNRFNLSDDEVSDIIEEIGMGSHSESQVAFLFKKTEEI